MARTSKPFLIALLATFPVMAVAAPLPRPGEGAKPVGEGRALAAWTRFCEAHPSECAVDTAQPARIKLDPKAWDVIGAVNRKVNGAIARVTDQDHWSEPDRWDLAEDGKGDAEDLALLKRRKLVEAGLPRRAMRMTVVIDERGEGHAVLTLVTDRGDYILDSKTDEIEAWFRTGYVFIKRESQDKVGWVSLGGAVAPGNAVGKP